MFRPLNINVGVLGHVDSGKTALVAALSTVLSTAALDKHPQSKQRGITLDLGFSAFSVPLPPELAHLGEEYDGLQFTLVDCPGHASLIRTVLGGAQIIDLMLLVIDVTKGFQAQTAECLVLGEIAAHGLVVALNKVDLLPPDERARGVRRATKLISKTLAATKFAGADVIPVATRPEPLGVDTLRSWLVAAAAREHAASAAAAAAAAALQPFLFAVDHCFAIKGQGTVLTGTVLQGTCAVGDVIELPTLKLKRQVKSIQSFKRAVTRAARGDRAALCVTQLEPGAIERGLAAAPGAVPTFMAAVAAVHKVRFYPAAVPGRAKYHTNIGHVTVMAEATFFGVPDEPCSRQDDALRLMVEALSRASLYNTAGQAKNTGNCTSGAFDFAAEYVHQDQLYGLEGRELSIILDSNQQQQQQQEYDQSQQPSSVQRAAHTATNDGSHYGPQWALLRFDQPVTAPADAAVICARLDVDGAGDVCRLAFFGHLVAVLGEGQPEQLRRLRVFKLKERKGMIERVLPDGMGAVCRGLFKRETDMSVFEGATVTIGSGLAGVVEGRFGTSGKCKLRLEPPGLDPHRSGGAGQGVTLRYKRYVHDSDVSRRSGVRQ